MCGLALGAAKISDTASVVDPELIKLSFRVGGEKPFHESLKGAMVQQRWMLKHAPPIPEPVDAPRKETAGIAGLERRGMAVQKVNESVIGSAFEDLEALMASAKELIAVADTLSTRGSASPAERSMMESAKSLKAVTSGPQADTRSLYLTELSRSIAEFVADMLHGEGGIMSLVDLWASYNQTTLDPVSPLDFEKAAGMWEKLRLPVRLRIFGNGFMVVQDANRSDDSTIAQLLGWLQDLRLRGPPKDQQDRWDWTQFGCGVSVQETAHRFGWAVGIAAEELDMAQRMGALCLDKSAQGPQYWENWLE